MRGQLNIDEAYVIGMNIRTVAEHLDYIAVHLESDSFVELMGSNRIRIVFEGCIHAQFDLQSWLAGRDRIYSFYVKSDSPMLQTLSEARACGETKVGAEATHYCIQFEHSNSSLDVLARTLKVEVEPSTLRHN